MNQSNIRNFSIIAHVDHGKSTLADRLIEHCNVVNKRNFYNQYLDDLYLERERGITIKSRAISLPYKALNDELYELNLIDTPGHVDFAYEVSRALSSCEGVLLVVDASQGVEAQTLANMYLALEQNLEILPIVNKIDLPSADLKRTFFQITEDLGLEEEKIISVSAKKGTNILSVLEAIVRDLPSPAGDIEAPLQALIFDAQYDSYRGILIFVRIKQGRVKIGDDIFFMSTGGTYKVEEVGIFVAQKVSVKSLNVGQVGYIIAGIKKISDVNIGDTVTHIKRKAEVALSGFKKLKPVVYSSIYPIVADDYKDLIDAFDKLKLNDSALDLKKDSSRALGFGFRCGCLGMLHLEIIQERLKREFGLSLIVTMPSVSYKIFFVDGNLTEIENPMNYPDDSFIDYVKEPYVRTVILTPERYIGSIMELCLERRGDNIKFNYPFSGRVEISVDLPLAEILYDFYNILKTITQGYASFDYEMVDYRRTDLVKLDILVNKEKVDALSSLVHRKRVRTRALQIVKRLKEFIPRQQFKVPIQGAIGGNIVARVDVSPFRKDVTSKCYGGDVSRKRKLLERQREGKKRMKLVGNVPIPQRAFLAVLQSDIE